MIKRFFAQVFSSFLHFFSKISWQNSLGCTKKQKKLRNSQFVYKFHNFILSIQYVPYLSHNFAKIILPAAVCSTLVTSTDNSSPMRPPASSTTIMVPSCR